MRAPEELGEAEVRQFLLYLREERRLSVGRYLQYLASLRFLFTVTLRRPEVMATIPWPKDRRKRPEVLTRHEVSRLLASAPSPYWCAFLTTAYGSGLRMMEVARLRAQDIDGTSGLIRVVCGKGAKSREVMLDPNLHQQLRAHWRAHELPGPWLFPARAPRGGWVDRPVNRRKPSMAFREAAVRAGITRYVTLRSLRTAFATHLLEDGVDVFTLQQVLGHADLDTTRRYAVVRTDRIRATPSPLSKLPK
jgi:site-specific recombinase XerD